MVQPLASLRVQNSCSRCDDRHADPFTGGAANVRFSGNLTLVDLSADGIAADGIAVKQLELAIRYVFVGARGVTPRILSFASSSSPLFPARLRS